jgi:sulfur-oxidizing protein SoxY
MAVAIRRLIGAAATKPGRIELTIPTVADNGNSISVTLKVASAMNEADRVKAVHLLNDGNPWPDVFTYRFGPRAGKAEIATRIRLARTQNVVALAEMADGTVWSAKADVTVAFGACAEEI